MFGALFHLTCLLVLAINVGPLNGAKHSVEELRTFLEGEYETTGSHQSYLLTLASYQHKVNMTKENQDKLNDQTMHYADFVKNTYEEWFKDFNLNEIHEPSLKRMMKILKEIGAYALSTDELQNITEVKNQMVNIYSTARVCPYKNLNCVLESEGLELTPDLDLLLLNSQDYNEQAYLWTAWHNEVGRKLRPYYPTYVELSNKMANLNGFPDNGAMWRDSFESGEAFIEDLEGIWQQLFPLYRQLHAYAKAKLEKFYGPQLDASDGLLPAHIFGNMWAQSWTGLEDLLKPFPEETELNLTKALRAQGYDVLKIFETSNEFYTSLGLPSAERSYGKDSLIERPRDGRKVLCHASAWDLSNGKDFLIKMCTEVVEYDFFTVHHEMGHIEYYLLYKDQLRTFRGGANPGFHEAVGDTISLSVKNIKHLKAINLLPSNYVETMENDINTLMSMALLKVAFIPFGYLIDKWRWEVFAGNITQDQWNDRFWELREKYQLVKPPSKRSHLDFDAGAKFHVPGDSQYISYFVSHILQFQFYRGLCIAAGEYNPVTKSPPLHQCDFYNNKAAGKLLSDGLSLGSSKPWPEVLNIIAGTDQLDASALLEYFAPLSEYLTLLGYE